MNDLFSITVVTTDEELNQILALQRANLTEALAKEERASYGFVTFEHDLGLLRDMSTPHPHVIAKQGSRTTDRSGPCSCSTCAGRLGRRWS